MVGSEKICLLVRCIGEAFIRAQKCERHMAKKATRIYQFHVISWLSEYIHMSNNVQHTATK